MVSGLYKRTAGQPDRWVLFLPRARKRLAARPAVMKLIKTLIQTPPPLPPHKIARLLCASVKQKMSFLKDSLIDLLHVQYDYDPFHFFSLRRKFLSSLPLSVSERGNAVRVSQHRLSRRAQWAALIALIRCPPVKLTNAWCAGGRGVRHKPPSSPPSPPPVMRHLFQACMCMCGTGQSPHSHLDAPRIRRITERPTNERNLSCPLNS